MKWINAFDDLPPIGKDVIIKDEDGYVYRDKTDVGWDKNITNYQWLDESPSFTLKDMIDAMFEGEVVGEERNVSKRKKMREKYFKEKFGIDI